MIQQTLDNKSANENPPHRGTFVLEALERRSLFSAVVSSAVPKLPSASVGADDAEDVSRAAVQAATSAKESSDDDEAGSDSEDEAASNQQPAKSSAKPRDVTPTDDDGETEHETEDSDSSASVSPSPSGSGNQTTEKQDESSKGSQTPSDKSVTDSGDQAESVDSPTDGSKAVTTAGASSEVATQTPFASEPVSLESEATSLNAEAAAGPVRVDLPIAALGGFGIDSGVVLTAGSTALQLIQASVEKAGASVAQVFSSIPIVTSSISRASNLVNALSSGNAPGELSAQSIQTLPQLAVAPVLRRFARLGNPMLLLNDSLAIFADESAHGAAPTLATRIRRAWVVTTLVLAVDAVLLFQMRKAFTSYKPEGGRRLSRRRDWRRQG